MRALKVLTQLTEEKAAGPAPSFTKLHLAKAIEIIGDERIGRTKLSERLGLGEGATRTLIDRLLEANLVKISRLGCELTKSGLLILNDLKAKLGRRAEVSRSSMTVGAHNFGILVRDAASRVKSGIEQRDAAVRVGAIGALTLVFKGGELLIPPFELISKKWPNVAKEILDTFQPEENDVIIIAGAHTQERAEEGGRAAAWTLIESSD